MHTYLVTYMYDDVEEDGIDLVLVKANSTLDAAVIAAIHNNPDLNPGELFVNGEEIGPEDGFAKYIADLGLDEEYHHPDKPKLDPNNLPPGERLEYEHVSVLDDDEDFLIVENSGGEDMEIVEMYKNGEPLIAALRAGSNLVERYYNGEFESERKTRY